MAEDSEKTAITQVPEGPKGPVAQWIEGLGQGVMNTLGAVSKGVDEIGGTASMGVDVFRWAFRRPYRLMNFFAQFDFLGVGSIFIVALTGTFSGMVFAHQSARAFEMFNAQSLVGPTVALTVTRELAPVFTALMVTMRAGSAICTELGTMRVTEQIDALETMAVSPVHYLVVPRVIAGLVMVPLLTMVFDFAGMIGGYLVAVYVKGVSAGTVIARTQLWLDPEDINEGLIKAAVFGFVVTLICSYKGFNATGGAKGVGTATTQAMVQSALSIFILDYLVGVFLH